MKRLLSVTALSGLLTLLRMLTGFIISKVIAIYTGPTGLAMLGQFQNAIGIVNGLVNAPGSAGVVRYTAENINNGYDKCSPWWKASLQWVLGILLIIVPIVCVFSSSISIWLFDNNEYYWLIIVTAILLPLTAINTLITSIINGQQKYKRYILLGAISTVVSTIVMIFLIYLSNIKGALTAAAINSSVSGLIMIIASLKQPWFKLKYWWGTTELEHKKKIGEYMLMAVTTALTMPLSLIIIRNILVENVGWDLAGQWQAVWKISDVYLSVITISLSTYYLPKLASIKSDSLILKEVNKTVIVIMPIITVMALIVYFTRDLSISILFTSDFHQARDLFKYQLAGDVVKMLSWMYAYILISKGVTFYFVITEVISSLVFICLSYFLIGIYGVEGVTIAYFINYLVYLIMILFVLHLNFKGKDSFK